MASKKSDKFTRCFADFVKYLNVVEPFDRQDGILDCRIGFITHDTGELVFWMQDLIVSCDPDNEARYSAVFDRVDRLVHDLNRCRSFVDDKIVHTFDLYDANCEELHFKEFRHDR